MRTAAPREGRDHDILVLGAGAVAAALLLGTLTAALQSQPVSAQGGVPCTAIDDDKERLACYDRALRAGAPAPAAQAPTPPAAQATSPAQSVPAQSPPANVSAAAAPAAGRDADEQVVSIVVVSVRALPGRETTFTAADGSIWVQTDTQRAAGLPDTPFEAEIKSGAMGSKFLAPKDRGRAIRVRAAER